MDGINNYLISNFSTIPITIAIKHQKQLSGYVWGAHGLSLQSLFLERKTIS